MQDRSSRTLREINSKCTSGGGFGWSDRRSLSRFLPVGTLHERVNWIRKPKPLPPMIPYNATTEDVVVTVRPVYLDGKSDAMKHQFVFGYFVRIENNGLTEVQLLKRHWTIRDTEGRTEEVDGEGVIGRQPVIDVGDAYEYNSFCVLETFTGTMHGYYVMERENGERFRVTIPTFDLCAAVN